MERCEPLPNTTTTSSLRIPPTPGSAVLWYNHHVAQHTGWMGNMDAQSIVGATPVQGEYLIGKTIVGLKNCLPNFKSVKFL